MSNQFDYFKIARDMLTIRMFEETLEALHREGAIQGSMHLCIGQEAIPVGVTAAIEPADASIGTYRGHGWAIARGADLRALFAELLGRTTGVNRGRGGSAYLSAPQVRFLGENSIVGAGGPIACGVAMAAKARGTGAVCTVSFGDGAMNQGALLESLNLAAVLRLPVVFICENNEWSELTPIKSMVVNPQLWQRAAAFGIAAQRVDGNDPAAVAAAVREALPGVRRGDGPFFLEAMTQRIRGHYTGDMDVVRTPEERASALAADPIARLERELPNRIGAAVDFVALRSEVSEQIESALAQAQEDPLAPESEVLEHVYAHH